MPNRSFSTKIFAVIFLLAVFAASASAAPNNKDKNKPSDADDQIVLAQISDTHIGLPRASEGAENLRRVVEMVNDRHPDAVIVTGDIGENVAAWDEAKEILSGLKSKNVFFVPGNHDIHSHDRNRWLKYWGPDYAEFQVKWLTIFGLDSQLLGNFDEFDSHTPPPVSAENHSAGQKMLAWLRSELQDERGEGAKDPDGKPVILIAQHVPPVWAEGGKFPPDPKPYWVLNPPYREQELDLLHEFNIKDVLVGHWHVGMVFGASQINFHVAPATSWSPFSNQLGFALHTIHRDGRVETQFEYIPGADPHGLQ